MMAWRLFATKPLSEPMMAYCKLNHSEHISVKFEKACEKLHITNEVWNVWKIAAILSRPQCVNARRLAGALHVTADQYQSNVLVADPCGTWPVLRNALVAKSLVHVTAAWSTSYRCGTKRWFLRAWPRLWGFPVKITECELINCHGWPFPVSSLLRRIPRRCTTRVMQPLVPFKSLNDRLVKQYDDTNC